jgi:hypothetical protein
VLVSSVILCCWVSFVEVCVTLHWTVQSGLWRGTSNVTMYRVRLLRLLRLLRLPFGVAVHLNWFAELVFESLHTDMLDNRIGPKGAKALGDAMKDNTTLTSLSLNLAGL